MFVRRKTNPSGTISVYVVDKSHGRYDVLKNFGTARNERDADILENKARLFIREQTGQVRDLFARPADEVLSGLDGARIQVAGPELIFGELYNRLGYKPVGDEWFRHLVIARILHPGSHLHAVDYLGGYVGVSAGPEKLFSCLDELCYPDAAAIRTALSRAAGPHGKDGVLHLFPLTYEAAEERPKVRRTRSVRIPVLYLGVLTDPAGKPLGYELWGGRLLEARGFLPALSELARRYRLKRLSVCATPGLLPPARRRDLEDHAFLSLSPDTEAAERLAACFRMNLLDLQVRPRRHRIRFRIEGHVCVCFCAYAVTREMERILQDSPSGLTLDAVRHTVLTMKRISYQSPSTGKSRSVLFQLDPSQKKVYDLIY